MKKILFLSILVLLGSLTCTAQKTNKSKLNPKQHKNFAVYVRIGLASQIHSYPDAYNYFSQPNHGWNSAMNDDPPTEKEFGKHVEDLLPVYGIGVNYNYQLSRTISFKPQVSYIQKGSSQRGLAGYSTLAPTGGMASQGEFRYKYNNRFHYVSFDLMVKFNCLKWKKVKPYFQTGIRNEFLLAHSLSYDVDMHSGNDVLIGIPFNVDLSNTNYPENSGYIDFNFYNIGLVNSLGFEVNNSWYFDLEVDTNLNYLVKNDKLKARNYLVSLNIGYKIHPSK